MLLLIVLIAITLPLCQSFFHHIHRSKLPLQLSSSLPARPEFIKEINDNQVLREKLADDEDSILLITDLSQFG
jgi:hypothetical protein